MIHIFFRHYNVGGSSNAARQDDRYQARSARRWGNVDSWFNYEKVFLNLLRTTSGQNVKINVVMDGIIEENWIVKYKDKFTPYEIVGGTDFASFFPTMDIVKNDTSIQPNDIVYLLENDYLHVDGWVSKVEELYRMYGDGVSYVSLYDHLDKYIYDHYSHLREKIIITKTHHWRTTPSTTGTFMLSKKIFDEDYDIHSSRKEDHGKFVWLQENRQRFLITPIPGLSTHCVGECSPTIDWQAISDREVVQ
jgi:hypothetical protein